MSILFNPISPFSSEIIQKAYSLAERIHKDQLYGQKPYMYHINCVHAIAVRHNLNPIVQVVAILHDTVEESEPFERGLVRMEIREIFGTEIRKMVDLVTVTEVDGKSREERHKKRYPELRHSIWAKCAKICDRIANIEECMAGMHIKKMMMYQGESEFFKSNLCLKGEEDWSLWRHYDTVVQGKVWSDYE